MGGMMRAPFTAVIFTLELTHNVEAMVPVLTATILSYAVTVLVMKRSILTEKVARRGYDLFREYGVDPLEIVRVQEVMTKNVVTIPVELPIQDVLSIYFSGNQKFRGYPVVDDQGTLQGILTASDLLQNRLDDSSSISHAGDLACKQLITIEPDASCREAAEKMASLNIGRLPVVSTDKAQRLLGIVTRSDLLKPRLSQHELERKKERIFNFRKPAAQRRTVAVRGG
jgi:CBS domain-containing protein